MDIPHLITIVQNYEELYNLRNPYYSNQQRRDNIWEEIGGKLNQPGNLCKERWARIRDNHRKALLLRKTKSGQAASKLKPPKYAKELTFLTPYICDEEERRSNLMESSDLGEDETSSAETPEIEVIEVDQRSESSTSSVTPRNSCKRVRRDTRVEPLGPTTAAVLQDYLSKKAAAPIEADPMVDFFINMAKTVKTFPVQDQVLIKSQVFEIVNRVEMKLAFPPKDQPMPSMTPVQPPPPAAATNLYHPSSSGYHPSAPHQYPLAFHQDYAFNSDSNTNSFTNL